MGSDAELQCAYNHLKHIRHPQLVTHGNHETTWSDSGGANFEKYWGHNGCTTESVGDYLFVAYPAGPYIKMADGTAQDGCRLAWVESKLKRAGKRRIISVCHYPLNKDLTNRTEIVSLLKKYGVSASLCGHYHKPRLMNFDSLPGILGRSLMLSKYGDKDCGYTVLTLQNAELLRLWSGLYYFRLYCARIPHTAYPQPHRCGSFREGYIYDHRSMIVLSTRRRR